MTSALFQTASTAFIRRDISTALSSLETLFARLPPAPSQTWGLDLLSKTRSQERWRREAAALFVTASVIGWKESHKDRTRGLGGDDAAAFFDDLLNRMTSLFLTSATPQPVLPPMLVQTLSISSMSLLGHPLKAREIIEAFLAAVPAEWLDGAVEATSSAKWAAEALEGYGALLEHYLVDVLAGGGNEVGLEEAKRLVEWNMVLSESKKQVSMGAYNRCRLTPSLYANSSSSISLSQRIIARLDDLKTIQTPPATEIEDSSSATPPSPDAVTIPEFGFPPSPAIDSHSSRSSAFTSPASSGLSIQDFDLDKPAPSPPRGLQRVVNTLAAHKPFVTNVVSSLALLLAIMAFQARGRRWIDRAALRAWLLAFIHAAWRDVRWIYKLATTITYI